MGPAALARYMAVSALRSSASTVRPSPGKRLAPTVAESLARLKDALAAAYAAEDRLADLLKADGLLAEGE